jgi:PAS domain S-box-containing protein
VAILTALLPLCAGAARPPFRTDPSYLIDGWETEDGLPENSATSMVQTPDGYLWFGTFNGLVRFDGLKFTVFDPSNTPQLPAPGVITLHVDKSARLWVSTLRGMAMLSSGRWRTVTAQDGWEGGYARTISERGNGDLLVTTFDGKIFEYANNRFRCLPDPPGDPGEGYLSWADENGRWWAIQNRFVGLWDGERWVRTISLPEVAAEQLGCAPARDGGMWLLVGHELKRVRNAKEVTIAQVPDLRGAIWSMSEDGGGNLWVCTYNRGLYRVSPPGHVRHWDTSNGLSADSTRFAFEDREQNLWVGTSGGGLLRFKTRHLHAFGTEAGLTERVVNSVCPDSRGNVWVATYGKGLFRLADGKLTAVPLADAPGRALYAQSVLADRAGRIWVGSYREGLWLLEGENVRRFPTTQTGGDNVISLFEDSVGRIWMGGGVGVAVFDGKEFRSFGKDQGLPPGEVCSIAQAPDGSLWLSNQEGVFRLQGDRFVEVQDAQRQSIRQVVCLKPDPDGTIWMGTANFGLLQWRPSRVKQIDASAGFPVKSIYGVLEDDRGYFWMPTNHGVARVSRADLVAAADGTATAPLTCQVLDAGDGFPGAECTGTRQPVCARDQTGRFWFATPKGIAMLEPHLFRPNVLPPPTHIEKIYSYMPPPGDVGQTGQTGAGAESVTRATPPYAQPIVFPAGIRRVEFRYTGLSFGAPEKLRFQVKIDGRDADWVNLGPERVTFFYPVRPGDYVFRVRAANDDGVWNQRGASLAFTVSPFFWQTRWFRYGGWLLLIVLGGGSVWLIAHVRHLRAYQELERAQRQSATLLELSFRPSGALGDRKQALRKTTELASRVLQVRRAGVWLLSDDETELHCADLYDGTKDAHQEDAAFKTSHYPRYFEVLRGALTIVAADACRNPRTSEFRAVYFLPFGITSILDATIRASGRLIGVLRLEHVGTVRRWRDDEVAFARAVADRAAQVLIDAQREKAGHELRESEQRMTLAAEAAQLGMWVWEQTTNQVWMSEKCRRIFGFPPRCEITYQDVLARIHPEDRADTDRAAREAVAARSRYEADYRLVLPDGTLRWVAARGAVTVEDDGQFVRVQGVSADVSIRKEAEERFRRVVEAAPNAMILSDAHGVIILVNGQAEVVFGYDRRELIGRPVEILIPERFRTQHALHRKSYFADPVARAMGMGPELFGLRRDGAEIPVEISLNPIRTSDGILVLTSIIDISQRRQAEAREVTQRNELARLSRLTMLGELSGSLAHELNQPLTSILSNAQAAQHFLEVENSDLREVREILADIVAEDKRAGEVIQRLRMLLRKGEVQQQELDLNEVVRDVLKIVRSDLLQHDVVVTSSLAPSLPMVRGDRVQLQQVILNLILNGCDAMADNDKADRKLSVTTQSNGDLQVCVSVSDLGCGLPVERVERVFEPFYTTKPHGTGLGLSICRTILTAHGGKLWASNNPRRGAIFHVSLPQSASEVSHDSD